jgi:hypothetical protein
MNIKKKNVINLLIILFSILAAVLAFISRPTITYGVQDKNKDCQVVQGLPDSACTPGDILSTSTAVICKFKYATSVRNVSSELKREVLAEYGIPSNKRYLYQIDHLISLNLGGSNNISNLFPETLAMEKIKSEFEESLYIEVCSGKMNVEVAQKQISTNWVKYDNLRRGIIE